MNKLFKPKTMRRILLFLALVFPVVYLCGGLFFALNGAHGEQIFADGNGDEYSLDVLFFGNRFVNTSTGEVVDNDSRHYATDFISLPIEENATASIDIDVADLNYFRVFFYDENQTYLRYMEATNPIDYITFGLQYSYVRFACYSLTYSASLLNETLLISGASYIPSINAVNFSDYIFSSPFASNNFVSIVGRDVMNGNADGFAPMNDLFRTVNDNVLHFDENDALAVFGFGYLYYAVNVIVIYEVVTIALKLLLLPLKVVDKLEVEKND